MTTDDSELDQILEDARHAAVVLARQDPRRRTGYVTAVADALEANADELIALAVDETHLTSARLRGELVRTVFQARLFAEEVDSGVIADAVIDHADPLWPMGPRPDLRRMSVPLGPVLVFAASNFPFAFSVFGGDTASALAAGCPVILKAHSYHPRLSRRTAELVTSALSGAGAPAGAFALIEGRDAGVRAIQDDRIDAAAFTGSFTAGRLLFDLASARRRPIPFYGELSSVNPVFVTRAAAQDRADAIAEGFVGSLTSSAGQLCTKPGVLIVPADSPLKERVAELAAAVPRAEMLHEAIARGFHEARDEVARHPDVVEILADTSADATIPSPSVLTTTSTAFLSDAETLAQECFGPAAIIVTYADDAELLDIARLFTGELTASIHGQDDEEIVPELTALLVRRVGRLLWNQWPTGVSVTYAQQHGGPYPSTTAPATTSVGMSAVRRFVRPVAFQGWPSSLLPPELRDDNPYGVPRRVDGAPNTMERGR